MKKKVIKLEVTPEKSIYYAVSCQTSLHKLAWELNNSLSFQLKQVESIQKDNEAYPSLRDDTSQVEINIVVVQNKVETGLFSPELPNIDYIIVIRGNAITNSLKKLANRIKEVKSILALIALDPTKVKSLKLLQIN